MAFQVASVQALTEEEDLETIPESEYKEMLKRFPEILKQNFGETQCYCGHIMTNKLKYFYSEIVH